MAGFSLIPVMQSKERLCSVARTEIRTTVRADVLQARVSGQFTFAYDSNKAYSIVSASSPKEIDWLYII